MGKRKFGTVRERSGRPGYYIQFTRNGQQVARKAGDTREDAEKKLLAIQFALERGKSLEETLADILGERSNSPRTFKEAAVEFLAYREPRKKPSTFRGNISRLRVLCRASWASRSLSAISSRDITEWVSKRVVGPKKVSVATANRDLNMASALFKWATRMGYVAVNPVRNVEKFSERGRERTLWLAMEECKSLLAAATTRFLPLLLAYLRTGMRCGEAIRLRWKSVDLRRRELTVEPETSKSGKARHIPLTEDLFNVLSELRGKSKPDDAPVFDRGDGKPWSEGMVRYWLKKTVEQCEGLSKGVHEGLTPHVLRHTFASHLAQRGASLHEIALLLGQSSVWVTQRYSHLQDNAGRRAIALLDDYITGPDARGTVSDVMEQYSADTSTHKLSESCPSTLLRSAT